MTRFDVTYPSSRCLPVHRNVLPTSRDEVGVPGTTADLGVLIVDLGLLAVDVSIFGLEIVRSTCR